MNSWAAEVGEELVGANLLGVVASAMNGIGISGMHVDPAARDQWTAQSPDLQQQGESIVKKFLKACCPDLMLESIKARLGPFASASKWLQEIVCEVHKLRAGTYDGARRKEARAQVATDGLSNLEVVTKIWVLVAHVMALCTSVGAVLPDSHWTTFIVYHLTATSLWMPDVDGLQRQGLRARAEQIARGKDNQDESVQVNYASAAVTVGWAAMASGAPDDGGTGVHNCTLHGPNSNHTTDDCNELKRRANGGKKTASPRGDSDDGKCRECGKTGHKKINCPKIKCRDCGQRGHIARKCSEPKAQSGGGGRSGESCGGDAAGH